MPVIFLSENNSLSKKVLSSPFSDKTASIFEIPFKKMKKHSIAAFRTRISKSSGLFLAEPSLKTLIPFYSNDIKAFFDSVIMKAAYEMLTAKKLLPCRFVIHNPAKAQVLSALDFFSDIALYGDNSLNVANSIYRETGAALPVISGTGKNDVVLCDSSFTPGICAITIGYDLKTSENIFGGDALKFYPKGNYSELIPIIRRPLTLEEASLLSDYDKKATFIIAF